ncbi:hypothetical protein BT67DRAFT_302021 [Trichocladium antarcticum]|uniref:Uncharacterized protein n=1 Tax=Trichocladium antarcticum TaxID=1450529 RepID=A0AAN6UKH6_9PEZI|nr:hypothetical protein BT67DRAFT_302021 [Trichocladium antarcticum]
MPCTVCVTRLVEGRAAACYDSKGVGICCYECSRLNHTSACVMPAENLQALVQDWYCEVLAFTRANEELPANLHRRGMCLIRAIRKSRKEIAAASAAGKAVSAPAASAAPLFVPRAAAVVGLEERVAIAHERQAAAAEQLVTMARIAHKTAKAMLDEIASHGRVLKRMEGILVCVQLGHGGTGADDVQ